MAATTIISFETAKQLWDYLSPENPEYSGKNMLYRGQSNSEWQLTPTVFRYEDHPQRGYSLDVSQSFMYEIQFLRYFVEYCDQIGIQLPGDSLSFRRRYLEFEDETGYIFSEQYLWPSDNYHELMAYAQHHGLPTRLLDWSKRSFVSAYFAASGALKSEDFDSFAVWILNVDEVKNCANYKIVKVPSGVNRNIAAQSGCFSLLVGAPFVDHDEYLPTLPNVNLIKLTLPKTEAVGVLDLCKKYGVSGATIFPDAYGVARAAEEELRKSIFLRSRYNPSM